MEAKIKEQLEAAMESVNTSMAMADEAIKKLPPEQAKKFTEWNNKLKTAYVKRDIPAVMQLMQDAKNLIPKQ